MEKEKIRKLLAQMTLEEKASLCSGADMFASKGIERLGIPAIHMSDGPHGLRKQEGAQDFMGKNESVAATCFPAACTTGCSFDTDLLEEMGKRLGQNCRKEDIQVLLGPGINIKRSPLCGRNFEYFSEDPYLSGRLGAAYVNGVQSEGVGTSLKHFAANNQETRRRTEDSLMDERTMREIYTSAFEYVVKKAKPWTVMASYNKIDGTYMTENRRYLIDLLRGEWGYDGMVVSDWAAVHDRVEAVKGGCALTMPSDTAHDSLLAEAVKNGSLEESVLDERCMELLELAFRCQESQKTGTEYDYEKAHREAVRIASESMVLLKNEEHILPLDPSAKLALIGKFAEESRYQGSGSSRVNPYRVTNILETAEAEKKNNIVYAQGFGFAQEPDETMETEAVKAAQEADAAVIFAGVPEVMESEGFDRWCMKLPACQNRLIEKICEVQPNTIVVLQNGGVVEMPWVSGPKAILEAYLGGEGAAEAIWAILTGAVNPSGRLAETFPKKLEDNPSYLYWPGEGDRVEYPEGVFVGYRYYETKKMDVLFPFGHGLSYTEFAYSNLQTDRENIDASFYETDGEIKVSVDVKNIGARPGKEVVQLYVGVVPLSMDVKRPVRELKGFQKVALEPGETRRVEFTLTKREFAVWDKGCRAFRVPGGTYQIQIGRSVRDIVQSRCVTAEDEYLPESKVYNIMTPVCDIRKHPVGKAFLERIMPAVDAVIQRMGKKEVEMPYVELMPKTMGLEAEPLQTIMRMTPQIGRREWEKFFEEINRFV